MSGEQNERDIYCKDVLSEATGNWRRTCNDIVTIYFKSGAVATSQPFPLSLYHLQHKWQKLSWRPGQDVARLACSVVAIVHHLLTMIEFVYDFNLLLARLVQFMHGAQYSYEHWFGLNSGIVTKLHQSVLFSNTPHCRMDPVLWNWMLPLCTSTSLPVLLMVYSHCVSWITGLCCQIVDQVLQIKWLAWLPTSIS